MRWRELSDTSEGVFALIYGPTGVGKTVSSLKSLPKTCRYYECDPKGVDRTLKGNVDFKGIKRGHPKSYEDLKADIEDNFDDIIENYKSMFIDGLSFFMNIELLGEIQRETGDAKVFDSKDRPLVNQARTDKTGYGALAALMNRFCGIVGQIASGGVVVVIAALQSDDPKWNRELSAGPSLAGKEFPKNMPGFFDLIGRVEKMGRREDGTQIFPPKVYFDSDEEESFMARWSGPALTKPYLPLDWKRILAYGKDTK
ncbi:hypothetical protein ES703_69462 [subsurface metagenome]